MKKLFFRSRYNAMRYVVVKRMAHCLFSECQPDFSSFIDDCVVTCECLLKDDLWTVQEVRLFAEKVWRSFKVD